MGNFTEEDRASLLTLARGAAIERFDDELQRVLDNIVDPNTAKGAREVTLKVKITPNKDGATAAVGIQCNSKVQPAEPCATMFYIGKQGGRGVAFEHDPEQLSMPYPSPTVVHERKAGNE